MPGLRCCTEHGQRWHAATGVVYFDRSEGRPRAPSLRGRMLLE